jgi:NADPH:quinone reductase-like Zn-dependent oxidoreductase
MKALLLSEYKHLAIAELPAPSPGAGEVLIRVAACGICGSDVHGYDGSSGRRIPPIVMGHEAAIIAMDVAASPSTPPSTAVSASSASVVRSTFATIARSWASPASTIAVPARLLNM